MKTLTDWIAILAFLVMAGFLLYPHIVKAFGYEDEFLTFYVNCRINDCMKTHMDKDLNGDDGGKLLEIKRVGQTDQCASWMVVWHDIEPAKIKYVIFYTPAPYKQYTQTYGDVHNNFRTHLSGVIMHQEDSMVIEQCDTHGITGKASLWAFIQPKYHK